MKQSDSIAKLAPALVKALSELKGVAKDSKNPHFKNDYASLEAVIDTAKPILFANGLAFLQGLGEFQNGAMTVSTRILHESGEWIESDFQMPVSKSDPQGTASASTYARRYSLMGILGLPAVDDDGEGAMQRNGPQAAPAASTSKNPTINVHPEGLDWWGATGFGMTAYEAKKQGLGEKVADWTGEIQSLTSADAWRNWCASHTEEIKPLPMGWRVQLREEADLMARELGVDLNAKG